MGGRLTPCLDIKMQILARMPCPCFRKHEAISRTRYSLLPGDTIFHNYNKVINQAGRDMSIGNQGFSVLTETIAESCPKSDDV
jgi:hypothetical protein